MKQLKIAPSILSADFSKMGEELKRIDNADYIHCDVMDGRFVPNITFGMKMVKDIKAVTHIPLDVHLMIVQPELYIQRFIDAGADLITFHIEAASDPAGSLSLIRSHGKKAGLVISPDTPVSAVKDYLSLCDIVLLMSVYPGFSGQKFIEGSLQRLCELRQLRDSLSPNTLIEIDGGITLDNVGSVFDRGVDIAVAGNTVFGDSVPSEAITRLKAAVL